MIERLYLEISAIGRDGPNDPIRMLRTHHSQMYCNVIQNELQRYAHGDFWSEAMTLRHIFAIIFVLEKDDHWRVDTECYHETQLLLNFLSMKFRKLIGQWDKPTSELVDIDAELLNKMVAFGVQFGCNCLSRGFYFFCDDGEASEIQGLDVYPDFLQDHWAGDKEEDLDDFLAWERQLEDMIENGQLDDDPQDLVWKRQLDEMIESGHIDMEKLGYPQLAQDSEESKSEDREL